MKSFRSYLARLDRAIFAVTFVASSQLVPILAANANPIPSPSTPSPIVPTRVILNGSFEQPAQSATGAGYGINEAYNNINGLPIIWRTTEPGNSSGTYKNQLEIWRGINTGNGGQSTSSGAGEQYAEINASTNAAIYQDICVQQGESVTWSLQHAARKKSTSDPTNIMQVSITDPVAWGDSKIPPTTQLYSSSQLSVKYSNGWKSENGTWSNSSLTNGITTTKPLRFAFQAIQGTDNDISYGNFIDNVSLNLSALIDFLPTDGNAGVNLASTTEGNPSNTNPPYYYLSLRVNGYMPSAASVKITLTGLNAKRSFKLGDVLKGGAIVSGLNATTSGNVITLNIPAGTYDANSPSNYIHIPIDFSDKIVEPTDQLTFSLSNATGGGSTSPSVTNLKIGSSRCGTVRDTVSTVLYDDDVSTFQKKI